MKRRLMVLLVICLVLAGCSQSQTPPITQKVDQGEKAIKDSPTNLIILSSSENSALEPMIKEFATQSKFTVQFVYKGSVDGMMELSAPSNPYDAVFLSHHMWISMGDKQKAIKNVESVMTSPVGIGIRKSVAQTLGFIGKDVYVKDILKAIEDGKLKFAMTSASQSNSGASFYLGALSAILGNPPEVSSADLAKPVVKEHMTELLSAVDRSSGSSGWLEELFLSQPFDAMVNYEAVIIDANLKLVNQGKEPLYLIYPVDGMMTADYPFGYYERGQNKQELFNKLKGFLLSDDAKARIAKLGRRTAFAGDLTNADQAIFNPDWGIDAKRVITSVPLPQPDVIYEALNLYQTAFKRPLLTYFVLDFSGSMDDTVNGKKGAEQLKSAMAILLDQNEARKYLLQSAAADRFVVVPFSSSSNTYPMWEATGKSGLDTLLRQIQQRAPGGGTDIFAPMVQALGTMKAADRDYYRVSVVLMTDGRSNEGMTQQEFERLYRSQGQDVPIFTIAFGSADRTQLDFLARTTHGKVFDGSADLISAFKDVRSYN